MKRGRLWLLVPLALVLAVVSPCLPHQVHLLRLEQRYDAIEHPTSSRLIARTSALGLLEGNGNHCDYFVGELRLAASSEAALRTFYGSQVDFERVDRSAPPPSMWTRPAIGSSNGQGAPRRARARSCTWSGCSISSRPVVTCAVTEPRRVREQRLTKKQQDKVNDLNARLDRLHADMASATKDKSRLQASVEDMTCSRAFGLGQPLEGRPQRDHRRRPGARFDSQTQLPGRGPHRQRAHRLCPVPPQLGTRGGPSHHRAQGDGRSGAAGRSHLGGVIQAIDAKQ